MSTPEASVAHTATPTLRYALQPRVGESLHLSPSEAWPIVAVYDHGRTIDAIDRVERLRRLVRAGNGCWLVNAREEVAR